tara:strand:- start:81 stop:722 length:642 start_codon:yes stop_codon:yes gene_type:complete
MKKYNVKSIEIDTLILNGKGDNIIWNKAEILTDFVSAWDDNIPNRIEFRSLWDSKNLFFFFKVFDNEVNINKKDNSKKSIGDSDRVELFFKTNDSLTPYYCLEIDPTSRILDFKANPKRNFEFDWNWPKKDLVVKSDIQNDFFTVEGAISIASLKKLELIKNDKIETGIFRAKYNKSENSRYEPTWISWVNPNTKLPDFHTPSSFGVLNLLEV